MDATKLFDMATELRLMARRLDDIASQIPDEEETPHEHHCEHYWTKTPLATSTATCVKCGARTDEQIQFHDYRR